MGCGNGAGLADRTLGRVPRVLTLTLSGPLRKYTGNLLFGHGHSSGPHENKHLGDAQMRIVDDA